MPEPDEAIVRAYLALLADPTAASREARLDAERAFVAVARAYGEMHGISRQAWTEVGVPADVLDEAGVPGASSSRRRRAT